MTYKGLLAVVLVGSVLVGAVGLSAAHDTETIDGYELTFGGAEEPVITGERTWLEVNIVDADAEEPVTELEDDLEMAVRRPFGDDVEELDVGSRFGQPGWYEAAVVFTEPGTYTVFVNATVDGTAIDATFQKQVHDAENFEYPADGQDSAPARGVTVGFGIGVVVTAVAGTGAFFAGRRVAR